MYAFFANMPKKSSSLLSLYEDDVLAIASCPPFARRHVMAYTLPYPSKVAVLATR